eukprot:6206186-Pleurochrysis_carterae.AAC.1
MEVGTCNRTTEQLHIKGEAHTAAYRCSCLNAFWKRAVSDETIAIIGRGKRDCGTVRVTHPSLFCTVLRTYKNGQRLSEAKVNARKQNSFSLGRGCNGGA